MNVSELFTSLSLGVFSNLALGMDGVGEIRASDQRKIIAYANDALLALHSRFVLREAEVLIQQVEHITHYHLKRRFAITSQSLEPYKYIIDISGEPFEEDVLKILGAYDSLGNQIVLNDSELPNSYFTPKMDTLQIPNPMHGVGTSVIYQARHPVLQYDGLSKDEMLKQEINIPFFMEGLLRQHIASQTYSHMNSQEHTIKAQEYLTLYEVGCVEIEEKDMVNQTISTSHDKLHMRGFV